MLEQANVWNGLALDTTQVLICDLQSQIVARSKTTTPAALLRSASVLLRIADLFSLPVTFSVVPEAEKAPEIARELMKYVGGARQMSRVSASPFVDPASVAVLASHHRRTLILAGFATEVVVLHAALQAANAGYRVLVAVDACGGMSERTETAAFRQMEASGAILTSVVSVASSKSCEGRHQ